ncbi:DNA-binding transcriptional LysR family regulator [Haloferula luteola]|uniref:DNA-binding transcriptional LysR family regulator n=1 Tax=Haloferula luteola TaxID=595692 RepID=A0A840VGQ8_9BACT|nr:LysR family transcriptional regulator [Haloferula luteola]MBB5353020.1 DNA-binding transcriptional LysR family regulator [Haloferula luteola]
MELRHLECLVEVVKCGGFSAAARSLGTTQPTVSKALQQLEHDCGAPLLDRLGHGVRLTDAGELVWRRATAILAERENLQAELAGLRGMERGRLRLGLPVLGSSVLFAPLVAAYRQRYPGIEIELHEQGSQRLEEQLRRGEIEMAATLAPVPPEMEWRELVDEPLLALLPKGHPLAGRSSVRFHELTASPFILFEKGFVLNAVLARACRKRGIELHEAARGRHADFVIALVSSGLGVSLLPRLEVEPRRPLALETALIDESDLRWRLGLIWRTGALLSPAAQRWLELVEERLPLSFSK